MLAYDKSITVLLSCEVSAISLGSLNHLLKTNEFLLLYMLRFYRIYLAGQK